MRALPAETVEPPIPVRPDDSPLHWHEAVAIVRSVADAVVDGRLGSVPSSGELALERDGSLHVRPGLAGRSVDAAHMAAALRQLLRDLVPPDAPAELRALAEGRGSAPVSSPTEFRDALAFFERPSSARDRQALASRLEKIQQERHLEEEIERLKRKARTEEHPRGEANGEPQPVAAKRLSRKTLAVLAASGAAGGVALALIFAPGPAQGTWATGASVAAANAADTGLVAKLRNVARSTFGGAKQAEAADPSAGKATPAPPQPASGNRRPRSLATSLPPTGRAPDAAFRPSRLEVTRLRVLPTDVSPPTFELKLPDDFARVFTGSDADVAPPVLVRPHLPTVASVGLPRGQLGTVDVLVAEDGRVEQVRLVSTTAERRYYDAMILAAVKAWVFRPAGRAGRSVRYRLQIRLT